MIRLTLYPFLINALVNLSNQELGDCFKPYKDFFNFHPYGCLTSPVKWPTLRCPSIVNYMDYDNSSIIDGEVKTLDGELSKGLLENNKCYLLDCGVEVFVWVGRVTQVEDRKAASQVAEDFVGGQQRPKTTRITRVIQGYENNSFKFKFDSWPAGSTTVGADEGRGKVAALLKQQGVGVEGMSKSTLVDEEVPPLIEGGGKMEVWCINGSAMAPLPKEDAGKFYNGDCYIVLYNYHSGERKEDYFLCCWIGKDSIDEDQKMAARFANTMVQMFEGKEPPQFIALFQPMVVLKISGTAVHNNKALQVNALKQRVKQTLLKDSQEASEAMETSVVPKTNGVDSESKQKIELDENGTYSYEQLKAVPGNAVTGINLKRKEAYLSDKEFQTVLGMEKEAFYSLPKWKQDLKKKKVDLF
ncbi:Villin-3 [Hibiscus syriacus]|uniref:Villin-3 n=2 Tax=Hibiscus syriacus TaxID=106335 RepID=A0A6A2ZTD6_HIBSY|nr:Villin-3 [Hibiscus syriacus]